MPKPVYKQLKCIACGDTGVNSRGNACICRIYKERQDGGEARKVTKGSKSGKVAAKTRGSSVRKHP